MNLTPCLLFYVLFIQANNELTHLRMAFIGHQKGLWPLFVLGGVGASFTVWYMKRWMEQCYGLKCCFEKIQYVCDNILLLQLTLPIYYLVRSMNKYYHSLGLPPDPVMSTGPRPRMTQLSITTGTSKQSSSIQEIMITQLSMTRFLTTKSKE